MPLGSPPSTVGGHSAQRCCSTERGGAAQPGHANPPSPLTPIGSRMQPTPRCKTSGKQRPLPALPSAEKLRASLRYFVLYFNTCVRSHRAKPTQPGESEQPNTERGRGWARTCRDQPRGRQRRIRKKHRINKLTHGNPEPTPPERRPRPLPSAAGSAAVHGSPFANAAPVLPPSRALWSRTAAVPALLLPAWPPARLPSPALSASPEPRPPASGSAGNRLSWQ